MTRHRRERSLGVILISVVLVFLCCHSLKLYLSFYKVSTPEKYCDWLCFPRFIYWTRQSTVRSKVWFRAIPPGSSSSATSTTCCSSSTAPSTSSSTVWWGRGSDWVWWTVWDPGGAGHTVTMIEEWPGHDPLTWAWSAPLDLNTMYLWINKKNINQCIAIMTLSE